MSSTPNGIRLRRATPSDLEDILRLNLALFKKEIEEYDKTLNPAWVEEVGRPSFREKIESPDAFVEVVEQDTTVVGYLCGSLVPKASYRKEGVYAELLNIFLEEEFRGVGLGTKLTQDFIEWCKGKSVNIILVIASVENGPALNLYRRTDFEDRTITLEKTIKPLE